MKTTKLIITALLGLFINAASAEKYSLETGYASDYFDQGLRKAEESIQVTIGVEGDMAGLGYSVGAFTNQSIETGVDSYVFNGGLERSFADELISAYVGLVHTEHVSGAATQEVELKAELGITLSPTVSILRDLDENLFAYELSLSHLIDVKIASLSVYGSAGKVETSKLSDTDYYSVGGVLSKSVSENASVSVSLVRVDSNFADEEFVSQLGISTQF